MIKIFSLNVLHLHEKDKNEKSIIENKENFKLISKLYPRPKNTIILKNIDQILQNIDNFKNRKIG